VKLTTDLLKSHAAITDVEAVDIAEKKASMIGMPRLNRIAGR
jgi:hypothetical protein